METLLDEVCGYINNYFPVKPDGIHRGKFTVEGGAIDADFLQEGQYFRIVNSVFNDGVHKYPAELHDEEFRGEVWAMAVPPAVIALLSEIEAWMAKFWTLDNPNMSPFASESFNNYSYTKSGGRQGSTNNTGAPETWQDVFGSKLLRWKRI